MDVFLPKGTRDLLPEQMRARQFVMGTVRTVFERFGFEPLETPAFERIETLMGKYGEEGDKLIYRILERGEGGKEGKADLALRYDLTVPLARAVAMHPELRFPWRRWQMQPVWRADRPQKGRFREFWQCDVDIVGTTSYLADAECLAVVGACMDALGFEQYTIRVNDRRILADLAGLAGATDAKTEASALISLDKLDKIGVDGVRKDLVARGFPESSVDTFLAAVQSASMDDLRPFLGERGLLGVSVLTDVIAAAKDLGVRPDRLKFDPTLARGLDYYTGPVFETVVDGGVGSVSGGGRYDNLIGMFSGKQVPSVGVSLGVERLIVVLEELGRLGDAAGGPAVMVAQFSPDTRSATLKVATQLRAAGISAELFVEDKKLGKQFQHADARGCRFVAVVGPEEAKNGTLTLKELKTGEQAVLSIEDAIARIKA